MIVDLETKNVEVADCNDRATELLGAVLEGELPAFAVSNTVDIDEIAQEQLGEVGFKICRPHGLEYREPSARRSKAIKLLGGFAGGGGFRNQVFYHGGAGLHVDSEPTMPVVDAILLHRTDVGVIEAEFYEPTATFAESIRTQSGLHKLKQAFTSGGNLGGELIPPELRKQIKEGIADDTIVIPVRHVAQCTDGTTVVARLGGQIPLIHKFTATQLPRVSTRTIAQKRSLAQRLS